MSRSSPPWLAEKLLGAMAPPEDRRFLLADMREEFATKTRKLGPRGARRWYRLHVATSIVPLGRRRLGRARRTSHHAVGLRRDLEQGLRAARRSPAFSLLVIGVIATGVGATTTVFSVASTVLMEPLPFEDPDRLVAVRTRDRVDPSIVRGVSGPDYFDYVERTTSLSGLFGYEVVSRTLSVADAPARRVTVAAVGHTGFDLLGAGPARGRGFAAEEDRPDGERVATISDQLWRSHFAASPGAIGSTLVLDGRAHVVVGIMPEGYAFPAPDVEIWTPLRIGPTSWRRAAPILSTVGRLAPDVSLDQARAELAAVAERLAQEHPDSNEGREALVVPMREAFLGSAPRAIGLLGGAVGILLLLACSNIANLVLARATARADEMCVRAALGASRRMLVRQLIAENLALALLGGIGGFLLARLTTGLLVSTVPHTVYRLEHVTVDSGMLVFSAGASVLAGLTFGTVPALRASAAGARPALARATGRRGRGEATGHRAILIGQVSLAMVLVVCAGLFGRSLQAMVGVDPGFEARGLLGGRLDLPDARYPTGMTRYPEWPEIHQFAQRAVEELRAIPGVTHAALGSALPLQRSFLTEVGLEDPNGELPAESVIASPWSISPEFLAAAGVDLLAGRGFGAGDRLDSRRVALVNDAFVRRHVPGGDPLGLRVAVFGRSAEIVGVVSDVTSFGLREPPPPTVYQPIAQAPVELLSLLVRGVGRPESLIAPVREAVRRVDPELAVYALRPMIDVQRDLVRPASFNTWLTGSFGALALLIAAVGILGVLAQSVERRVGEIGVRMALGARPRQVLIRVIGEAVAITTVGVGLGICLAVAFGRLLRGFLFEVTATDPLTYGAATVLLLATTALAAWRPARRAAMTDPIDSLRRN